MHNPFSKDQWIQVLILIITVWIWITANKIANKQADIAESQLYISDEQTRILTQQTNILDQQTQISRNALKFEQDKNWSDITRTYREKIESLVNELWNPETTFWAIHKKIRSWEDIINLTNLDRYTDEFENIGALYCGGKIKLEDLRFFSAYLEPVCWSKQIYYRYQFTDWKTHKKSWIAGICKSLFPKSTMMAKFANPDKCVILKNK